MSEEHLKSALEQQKVLVNEIQELNNTMIIKKEQFLKLQGIIEYLNSIGVSVDDQEVSEEKTPKVAIEESKE